MKTVVVTSGNEKESINLNFPVSFALALGRRSGKHNAIESFKKLIEEGIKPSKFTEAVSCCIPLHPDDSLDSLRLGLDLANSDGDYNSVQYLIPEKFVYKALGYSDNGRN